MAKKPQGRRKKEITYDVDALRLLIDYDKHTGAVYWKEIPEINNHWTLEYAKRHNMNKAGDRVDRKPRVVSNRNGYRRYHIVLPDGSDYLLHRVIWAWMTGEWPKDGYYIDHIDLNEGMNNRWDNLRMASRAENGQNYNKRQDNTTGVTGVSYNKRQDQWKHDTQFNNVRYLSMHKEFDDAVAHRKLLFRYLGFAETHGTTKEERDLMEQGIEEKWEDCSGVYRKMDTKQWMTIVSKSGCEYAALFDTKEEAEAARYTLGE